MHLERLVRVKSPRKYQHRIWVPQIHVVPTKLVFKMATNENFQNWWGGSKIGHFGTFSGQIPPPDVWQGSYIFWKA